MVLIARRALLRTNPSLVRWLLAALLVLATAETATAASADLATHEEPTSSGPTTAHGRGVLVVIGGGGLEGTARLAAVVVTSVEREVVATPLGDVAFEPRIATTRYSARDVGLAVDLDDVPDSLLAVAAERLEIGIDAPSMRFAPREAATWYYKQDGPAASTFSVESPDGWRHLETPGRPALEVRGDVIFRMAEGTLLVGDRVFPLRTTIEQHAAHRVERYAFAEVSAASIAGTVAAAEGRAESAFAAPWLDVQGSVTFPNATGHVEGRRVTGEDITIRGALRLAYPPASRTPTLVASSAPMYRASGEFASVIANGHVLIAPGSVETVGRTVLLGAALAAAVRFLVALYTRLTPRGVFEQDARRRLFEAVRANPGIHARALQRLTGYGWGKLHYHLHVLRRAGALRLERRGKHLHVLVAGARLDLKDALAARGLAWDVLASLPPEGGATVADVRRRVGCSSQLAQHHLRALAAEGLARAVEGRPRRYVRAR